MTEDIELIKNGVRIGDGNIQSWRGVEKALLWMLRLVDRIEE